MTTSMFGHYPIQIDIGGIFHPDCLSQQVGKGKGGIHHPIQSKEELGNHQFHDPAY